MKMKKAQSTLEYGVLIIVIAAALLTMQVYIKRGIQGNWRRAIDDLGDHYDPGNTSSDINYALCSEIASNYYLSDTLEACARQNCLATRVDTSNSYETRNVQENIAGY